jgi:hypothetical protein
MLIAIDINSEEAETILFSLAMRSRQKNLIPLLQQEVVTIGKKLDDIFTQEFGWGKTDRMKSYRTRIKSVSIKGFDLPPTDA